MKKNLGLFRSPKGLKKEKNGTFVILSIVKIRKKKAIMTHIWAEREEDHADSGKNPSEILKVKKLIKIKKSTFSIEDWIQLKR